jgi:hypothetical protein
MKSTVSGRVQMALFENETCPTRDIAVAAGLVWIEKNTTLRELTLQPSSPSMALFAEPKSRVYLTGLETL